MTNARSARLARSPRNLRGFTLVELVVVMLIIGLLASVAMPRFANSQALRRVEAAANRLSADLELARRRARISSTSVTVTFNVGASSYQLGGIADLDRPGSPYQVLLGREPYGVSIASATFGGDTAVTFDGYGRPNKAGAVKLAVGDYATTVKVTLDGGRPLQEASMTESAAKALP